MRKGPVSFIIVDNKHLTKIGVRNLIQKSKRLYLVTTNKNHPAVQFQKKLDLIYYPREINFNDLFQRLKKQYKISRVTVQSGGTLKAILARSELIDRVSLVVAPALIGGKDTSTLLDGPSLRMEKDLKHIKTLQLIKSQKLKNSYLHLVYEVVN